MYGTQTNRSIRIWYSNDGKAVDEETGFENDVKMYGTQTWSKKKSRDGLFENDVKMYGTQTNQ